MPLSGDVEAHQPLLQGHYKDPTSCSSRSTTSSQRCQVQLTSKVLLHDASGAAGASGHSGHDGSYPGGRGGDGTHGLPGSHAGIAAVILRGDGEGFTANGQRYAYNAVDSIEVRAKGGAGGHGGSGGCGGDGAPGVDGRDATPSSYSTPGGRGGPGGNGGNGGDGGRGGDGGQVVVATAEDGSYLLMMMPFLDAEPAQIASSAAGGSGGMGGSGGSGGSGGRGGRGGSGCTWTTTDSQGNTHHHSHSGSSNGSPGPDGANGSRGRQGDPGKQGYYGIQVAGMEYVRRYHMACTDFKLIQNPATPEQHDGIFEFGEIMACNRFKVQNPSKGSMSTPTIHQRAEIYLRPNAKWTEDAPGGPQAYVGPKLSMPGHTEHTLPDDQLLNMFVKYPNLDSFGDDFEPFHTTDRVFVNGKQLGHVDNEQAFVREYHSFGNTSSQEFEAHFPVLNKRGIDALASVAAGERCIIRFHIKNSGRLPLGDNEESGGGRKVIVQWEARDTLESHSSQQFVDMRDEYGKAASVPFHTNLQSIPDVGSDYVELQAGWKPDTPDFSEVSLHAALGLEAPSEYAWKKAPESMRWKIGGRLGTQVQRRKHIFRCVPTFDLPPKYSEAPVAAIVVYSPGAHSNVCRLWVNMLREDFGIPTSVWNMSRYGHFLPSMHEDLDKMITNAQNLLIVVFDYPFVVQGSAARSEQEKVLPSEIFDQTVLRDELPTSRSRMLIISHSEDAKKQATRRLGALVDLQAFSMNEAGDELDDGGYGAVEGHFTVPCVAHSATKLGLPDGYNRRLMLTAAKKLCHQHGVASAGKRALVVHKQMPPERIHDQPAKCGCRTAWQVADIDLMLEPTPIAGAESWDLPLEVNATCGPHDLGSCQARLRSLQWMVVASLPRAAIVDLLVGALADLREVANAGVTKERPSNRSERFVMLYVSAFLQEVKRDIEVAAADVSRPVEDCIPSLALLNQRLAEKSLSALPSQTEKEPQGSHGVHVRCYCKDDNTLYQPVIALQTGKKEEPDIEEGKPQTSQLVAVDTAAGLLLSSSPPEGESIPQTDSSAWCYSLGLVQQKCFMWWDWWQLLLFSIASLFTLGLFLLYLCLQPHVGQFKRLHVLALPPSSGLTSKAHALCLNASREILCGLRHFTKLARVVKSPPGGKEAKRPLVERFESLMVETQSLLLPQDAWVPCTDQESKKGKGVEAFLRRRFRGMDLQRSHLAGGSLHSLFSVEGWAKWADPVVWEQSWEFHMQPRSRSTVISALEWNAMHNHSEHLQQRRADRSGKIVDKQADMIVTDATVFISCEACGRRIPEHHRERHESTECAKRLQGLDYSLKMLSTPADRALLNDGNISALEEACEEGHSALQKEEAKKLKGLLEYIRLERRLGTLLESSVAEIDPFELQDLVDRARTAAAGRALGGSDPNAHGVFVAEGLKRLGAVVQSNSDKEFEEIVKDGVLECADTILAEPNPPTGQTRREVLKQTLARHEWGVRDYAGHRRLQRNRHKPAASSSSSASEAPSGGSSSSTARGPNLLLNAEVDDDGLMKRAKRFFELIDLARDYDVGLSREAFAGGGKIALAHLWLGNRQEENLSMRLQFCRRFNLQGHQKYIFRLEEVKHLKQLPADWDANAILERGGSHDFAVEDVSQEAFIKTFQELFDMTFKVKYTRDRKGGKVPHRLKVVGVKKVMNRGIWENYVLFREKVRQSWARILRPWPPSVHRPVTEAWPETESAKAIPNLMQPLVKEVNETWLFHGTGLAGAEGITKDDFNIDMAGSAAGTLYGRGIYLAECSSKSDEYTHAGEDDTRLILVCRATLGSILYTDEATPQTSELESKCGFMSKKTGKYHSVLGDREKCRGTFREFIVFNSDLVYPAFIVSYKRE